MRLRFHLLPWDIDLLDVHERLHAMGSEREAGQALRILLEHVLELGRLPNWFIALPRRELVGIRSRTLRYSISLPNPALHAFIDELEPLSNLERDLRVKLVLRGACMAAKSPVPCATDVPAAGSSFEVMPTIAPLQPLPALQPEPEVEVGVPDPEEIRRSFKANIGMFNNDF